MMNGRAFYRVSCGLAVGVLFALTGCGGTAAPAISVSVSPTSATLIGGATQSFTATVSNDSSNSGVTWSATTGTISLAGLYTAPAVITTTTATVTATSVKDTTKSATANITLTPISVNAISPATVTLNGGGSQAFTVSVANDGSSSGVTWSIGSGVGTLSNLSTTGVTYTAPAVISGSSAVTVSLVATSVKDPTKSSAAAVITLNPITVSVPTVPVAMIGGATQSFTATVGNDGSSSGVTWSVTSGGGSFNPTALLSGASTTYTAASPVTAATAVVTATSVKDPTKSASATIPLTPIAVSFTTATSGITLDAGQTLALSAAVANDGSASGATFNATGAGTVSPASATGNAPSTTLTATGTVASTVTVTATSVKDTTKSATTAAITVNPALAISTAAGALTAGATNSSYAGATITATGGTGTKTFALATGALPGGLVLSTSGVITGSVTANAGVYTFTVKVTDAATTPMSVTSGSYTITITATPLVWTSPSSGTLTYTVGTAITPVNLATTGGTGAVSYSVNGGSLPAGLTLSGSQVTGTVTAATVLAGNAVTFLATDSATPTHATSVSPTVTFVVNPVTLVITNTALPTGTVGAAYNGSGYMMTSTGGTPPITWSMSPATVDGLSINATTGVISGTPTATNSSSVTITAKDSSVNQQQSVSKPLTLTVTNALAITSTSPLTLGVVGTAYSNTLQAAGGTGGGYTWAVTSGSSTLTALGLSVSNAGVISGTPTAAGTANFTMQVTDSGSNTASASFSLTVYAVLTLPAPNPSSLGAATVNQSYTGSISSSGGVAPYTWTVNSTSVPTNGSLVALSNGLSVSNNGSGVLNVSGTPTATGTVSFTASTRDSNASTAGPFTYSIAVSTTYSVSGSFNLANNCGGSSTVPPITVTLSQGSTTILTTTSSNGSYSFTGLSNGTYTITPSYTATGASVIFYPASQSVTVFGSNLSNRTFNMNLGYTVSGTVSYSGTQTGQIYLGMNNSSCGGGGTQGTSISAKGAFTIHGVPPGTYTLNALMDTQGKGSPNAADPSGSTGSVVVGTAAVTGVSVAISDPATVTLMSGPTLSGVVGLNTGIFAAYKPTTNSNGVETATSYTLQWSTTSAFTSIAGSKTFPAVGTHTNVWFMGGLTNGSVYYFRAFATSGGTATSPYSAVSGPVTIGANTTGSAVSGAITFSGTATGPMYAGLYNQSTGVFYGQYIASPTSPQPYTVTVPNSSSAVYEVVGVIDQNNDGVIDAGDLQNTQSNVNPTLIAVTGTMSGENVTLPSSAVTAVVTTQNNQTTNSGVVSQNYGLSFQVANQAKLPVAVQLTASSNADGANVPAPMDMALCAVASCGQGFQVNVYLGTASPAVNDAYPLAITYSDGTTGTATATVTGVLSAFATNLLPNCNTSCTSVSTTPTFTWTDPANASNYTYSFNLSSSSGEIWQIPGNNSNSNGFASTIMSIVWGTDPTGNGSTPSIGSLVLGTNYVWNIQVQDSNGNSATQTVNYQP